jgi:hypothetical protein
MNDFDIVEWRKKKKIQDACEHAQYRVELTETTNGNPLRRFQCVSCEKKHISMQLTVSDVDRKVSSVRHGGKTLQEISTKDLPYLYWVAVKSKMPQIDRYACARICAGKPYTVPEKDSIISKDELYTNYITIAREFITSNGGVL